MTKHRLDELSACVGDVDLQGLAVDHAADPLALGRQGVGIAVQDQVQFVVRAVDPKPDPAVADPAHASSDDVVDGMRGLLRHVGLLSGLGKAEA